MLFKRENVAFTGKDNVILRGWLYRPALSICRRAGIVMTHGFSAIKELGLDGFASLFCGQGGFHVLVYDHRTLGESDGQPRQDIDPYGQIDDYSFAITFLQSILSENGKSAPIGIWGTSYSGGHVFVVATRERKRVKCVVAQVPTISGKKNLTRQPAWQKMLADDGEQTELIPIVNEESRQKENEDLSNSFYDFFLDKSQALGWINGMTRRSLRYYSEYEPWLSIEHISPIPLLMIVAKNDRVTSTEDELDAFERLARDPKRLVEIEGGHFSVYNTQGEAFRKAANEALTWFIQYLHE